MIAAKPLPWQTRADLFAQLGAMEKAGLPALQAFGLLKTPPVAQERVKTARKLLARGIPLAKAGRQSGLFTELEASLIGAASEAGSPASSYQRLAGFYSARAMQARTVKSRMLLPGFMLIISLFLGGLPALVAGDLSLGSYLWHALRPLIVIAALVLGLGRLYRVQQGSASALRLALDRILMQLPLFGAMLVRRNIRDFIASLALLVEAGMPILDALPRALDTIQLAEVKAAFAVIEPEITRGATLSDALEHIALLKNSQALALIHTGEGSGSLPEMLFRFADMESAAINNFYKQVADWLPRVVYLAVAAWVAYSILTGPGIVTPLPEDLR